VEPIVDQRRSVSSPPHEADAGVGKLLGLIEVEAQTSAKNVDLHHPIIRRTTQTGVFPGLQRTAEESPGRPIDEALFAWPDNHPRATA
jgi:hypothetical protein